MPRARLLRRQQDAAAVNAVGQLQKSHGEPALAGEQQWLVRKEGTLGRRLVRR